MDPNSRVFIPETQQFGTVIKSGGILGFKKASSYTVIDDTGKKLVFVGKSADDSLVNKSTCKTASGKDFAVPVDISELINDKKFALLSSTERASAQQNYEKKKTKAKKASLLKEVCEKIKDNNSKSS